MLKDIWDWLQRLSLVVSQSPKEGHKIETFWPEIIPYLNDRYKDDPDLLAQMENVTQCVKEFFEMDPFADAFRYPFPKSKVRRSTPKNPPKSVFRDQLTFDVVDLASEMENVENFLCIVQNDLRQQWQQSR